MDPNVDIYIKGLNHDWQREIIKQLRSLAHEADPDIKESIKWGTPAFDHDGPVVWMFCAKEWVHFSFPQGALLDSKHGLFEPTDNKAQRTIKFREEDEISSKKIVQLIQQAVKNNLAGKKVGFGLEPKQALILSEDMSRELKAHSLDSVYFDRPYYQQKGYIQWTGGAKQAETRKRRIAKMIEELESGTYMQTKSGKK